MREALISVMLVLPFFAICNSIVTGNGILHFVRNTPAISTWQHMESFKSMVAKQMYSALVQILLLIVPVPVFVAGVMMGALNTIECLYFILPPSLVVLGVGLLYKKLEHRAQTLPVSDEFSAEYQRVIEVWMKKPLPKW